MCEVLCVSTSGYYDWIHRAESQRSKRHKQLTKRIRQIYEDSHQIYGSPRIHSELVDQGEVVGVNTVAWLMHKSGIQSKVHKRFIVTTNSRHNVKPAENLLNRNFYAKRANEKWVSDVTFIPTREGWLFLATIMDLYSRMIIGWSMARRHTTDIVNDALEMAITNRSDVNGVLLHSDQGIQCVSREYQQRLHTHGITCSMSRKGNCWDNAPMESFYHSLKTEWTNFEDYQARSEAKSSLFNYIELFYNRKRRHSSLNNQSPMVYEQIMGAH
jgi:putative transposase